ncbi:hypothetical protein H0H81_007856 [Sphagnurus paluster]|uniref:Peptidase A1 domain-containing protein n=1 Tax=Sphagnurus paluster TaxID=117069 RepID=A0A9P7K122_9AGAR|nr:hypothetical protein H0H81_007856 [Sphagnurus paluster]
MAANRITPPFYHMVNKRLIDEPIFSLRLGSSEADAGEVVFGGIDRNAYKGEITYVPVRGRGYWEVELQKFSFGDEVIELENTGALIDTGTSLIGMPADIAELLNDQIGATRTWNGYQVDCATVSRLPELSFYFAGKAYPLRASDYIVQVQGVCMSAFTPINGNLPGEHVWVLGESGWSHHSAKPD